VSGLSLVLAAGLALFAWGESRAAEPVTVTVQGVAGADRTHPTAARDQAVQAGILEAITEVTRGLLRAPVSEEDEESLRTSLEPLAATLVLTYRIEPGGEVRPMASDPNRVEYVVRVTATIDAAQLRHELERLGYLRETASRPSLLLRVSSRSFAGSGGADPRLEPLERALRAEFLEHGFIVLDPGVLPGPDPQGRSAFNLARATGADVGVEIGVRLKQSRIGGHISGVVAEVDAVATRAADGYELARIRLDTPGYHRDPDEASMRALEAVQAPLAQNLRVQLEQNWVALAGERRSVHLVLRGVTSFAQVTAVWDLLRDGLGVEQVELDTLAPALAQFSLGDAPSPAVLQARLTQAELQTFRLESLEVTSDTLEMVIRER
jgi:hypothetical protein